MKWWLLCTRQQVHQWLVCTGKKINFQQVPCSFVLWALQKETNGLWRLLKDGVCIKEHYKNLYTKVNFSHHFMTTNWLLCALENLYWGECQNGSDSGCLISPLYLLLAKVNHCVFILCVDENKGHIIFWMTEVQQSCSFSSGFKVDSKIKARVRSSLEGMWMPIYCQNNWCIWKQIWKGWLFAHSYGMVGIANLFLSFQLLDLYDTVIWAIWNWRNWIINISGLFCCLGLFIEKLGTIM